MIQPHWWLIETIGHPAVAGWHSSSPHIVPDSVSGKFCRKLSFWQISGGFVTLDSGLGFKAQYLQSGASTEIVCAPSGLDRVYRPEFLAPSRLPSAYRRGLRGPSSRSLSTCTARRFGLSPSISGYPGHMPGHPYPQRTFRSSVSGVHTNTQALHHPTFGAATCGAPRPAGPAADHRRGARFQTAKLDIHGRTCPRPWARTSDHRADHPHEPLRCPCRYCAAGRSMRGPDDRRTNRIRRSKD